MRNIAGVQWNYFTCFIGIAPSCNASSQDHPQKKSNHHHVFQGYINTNKHRIWFSKMLPGLEKDSLFYMYQTCLRCLLIASRKMKHEIFHPCCWLFQCDSKFKLEISRALLLYKSLIRQWEISDSNLAFWSICAFYEALKLYHLLKI